MDRRKLADQPGTEALRCAWSLLVAAWVFGPFYGAIGLADEPSVPFLQRPASASPLRALSDDQLAERYTTYYDEPFEAGQPGYGEYVCEMLRRTNEDNRREQHARLKQTIQYLERWEARSLEKWSENYSPFIYDTTVDRLLTLTGLRRIAEQPDPLALEAAARSPIRGSATELPAIEVKLSNVDIERRMFTFICIEGFRNGNFEVQVWDAEGRLQPCLDLRKRWDGGGLYAPQWLPFGKSLTFQLPLERFAKIPGPGSYVGRVRLHLERPFLNEERNSIYLESPAFLFEIKSAAAK